MYERVETFFNVLYELNANIWIITNSSNGTIRRLHENFIKKSNGCTKIKFFYALATKEISKSQERVKYEENNDFKEVRIDYDSCFK